MNRIRVNNRHEFDIAQEESLQIDGEAVDFSWVRIDDHSFHVLYQGKSYRLSLDPKTAGSRKMIFTMEGKTYHTHIKDELDALIEKMGMKQAGSQINELKAPMPGLVLEVLVAAGDQVEKDQPLLVLEAMKMENVIKSPGDALVSSIEIAKGDKVDKNQLLIHFGT